MRKKRELSKGFGGDVWRGRELAPDLRGKKPLTGEGVAKEKESPERLGSDVKKDPCGSTSLKKLQKLGGRQAGK